jgi:hypothetical protein
MNRLPLLALAFVAGFGSLAQAETITATLTGLQPYVFPTVKLSYNSGAVTTQVTGGTGAILWSNGSTTNPTNDPAFTGNFTTYCIDLLQDIYFGQQYKFDVADLAMGAPKAGAYLVGGPLVSPMGTARADAIQKLYDLHYGDTLGATPDGNKTAFQLAIWNIIYDVSGTGGQADTSVSSGSGNFYVVSGVNGSVVSTANSWLADVFNPALTPATHSYAVQALIGENGAQDQIYASPSSGSPAPTPSVLAGGLALLSLCGLFRLKGRLA